MMPHTKILSVILSIVLSATMMGITVSAQEEEMGNWSDAGLYGAEYRLEGEGTAEHPYQIKNAQDLGFLSYATKSRSASERIEDGIDETSYLTACYKIETSEPEKIDMSAHEWTPIYGFSGSFDGGGIPITGLTIKNSAADSNHYVGFFASIHANNNVITNLGLEDIQYTANDVDYLYLGGIAGNVFNYGGEINTSRDNETVTISNSYVTGTITCTQTLSENGSHIGGIIGDSNAHSKSTYDELDGLLIRNCHTNIDISIKTDSAIKNYSTSAGGILGSPNAVAEQTISDCYAEGSITAEGAQNTTAYLGGIFGQTNTETKIERCFARNRIVATGEGTFYTGSIGGESNGAVTGCYTVDEKQSPVAKKRSGTELGVSALIQLNDGKASIATIENLPLAEAISCTSGWRSDNEALTVNEDGTFAVIDNSKGGETGISADIEITLKQANQSDPVEPVLISARAPIYIITTPEQMQAFSEEANAWAYVPGKLYVMGSDIDMQGTEFNPIGTEDRPFLGQFDGGGKTISNLTVPVNNEQKYNGLFGYLQDTTVSDVTLEHMVMGAEDAKITQEHASYGCIAGYAKDSVIRGVTIKNSSFAGINTAQYSYLNVGAVAGQTSGEQTCMEQCNTEFSVTIRTDAQTANNDFTGMTFGGILGDGTHGTVRNCTADFSIRRTQAQEAERTPTVQIGGILGHAYCMVVDGCNAVIDIEYQGVNSSADIGGIAGLMDSAPARIINCTACGTVNVNETGLHDQDENGALVGGMIGWHGEFGDSAVENCFSSIDYQAQEKQQYPSGNLAGLLIQPGEGHTVRTAGNFYYNMGDWEKPVEGYFYEGETGKVVTEDNYAIAVNHDLKAGELAQPISFTGVVSESYACEVPVQVTEKYDITIASDIETDIIDGLNMTAQAGGTHMLTVSIALKGMEPDADEKPLVFRIPVEVEGPLFVSFETNGGEEIEPQQINSGNILAPLPVPKKSYYIFEGWYQDEQFTKPWDLEHDVVTENMKLFAKWTPKTMGQKSNDTLSLSCIGGDFLLTATKDREVVLLIASYDEEGRVAKLKLQNTVLKQGIAYKPDFNMQDVVTSSAKTVKVLVWDNIENAKPLIENLFITI
jgi:uncharacterized repeat protein (TIGR02543 family)